MDVYIGAIVMFAGMFAPKDWAYCHGQLLSIRDHQALYSLLGNAFGGDGRTNFALPKLSDPAAQGPHYIIALEGIYPPRP